MGSTKIVSGAFGFACDDERKSGYLNIAIRANLIIDVSKDLEGLRRKYPDADIVDQSGKIFIPTLFNSHFHPEALICRAVEPHLPISQWRSESLLQLETSLDAQDEAFYEKMYHLAFFGALQCGVSSMAFSVIGDEVGARGMYSAVKLADIDAVAFAESEQQIGFLRKIVDRHLKCGVFVPYQKDLTLFGLSAVARSNSDSPAWIMTHADEAEEDIETTKANFNSGIIQLLKKSRILTSSTILVGVNGTASSSLKTARSGGARIVLIPDRLNVQNFKSIKNVYRQFAIGSDWSTPGLFGQMKKLLEIDCEPYEALSSATRAGAELFNLDSKLGSIEPGKFANLAFLDARKMSARRLGKLPPESALRALIEDYSDSDVVDVMLDGEFVYRDRNLLLYDSSELMREGDELIERVGKYIENSAAPAEEKSPSMKVPETRTESAAETEQEPNKVELPKNIRKVFGEDEF